METDGKVSKHVIAPPVAVQSGKKPTRIKKANSLIFFFLRAVFKPTLWLLYRFRFNQKSSKGIKRPCLILANHQSVFDQFALSMGFRFGINYVASDTIFRHGLLSKLMVALTRPIPFSKGNSDLIALKNMMAVIKSGGCVAMFPSGNRSFYGDECKIVPGIGKLAKKFNVPLVLVQMRGGFNTLPRWKVKPNRGKVTTVVSRVVQPAELATMTTAEVDDVIQRELGFNEFEWNKTAQIAFRGNRKAEHLESVLFYCPGCNKMNEDDMGGLISTGNELMCLRCGAKIKINDTGFIEKIRYAENVPDTILEWSRMQLEFVKSFDFSRYTKDPVFTEDSILLYKAERAKKEHFLGEGYIRFYADRINVCDHDFHLTDITMAIQGVRKLTIYRKDEVYAVLAPHRTNLVKFMICGYHLRNKALGVKEEYYGY